MSIGRHARECLDERRDLSYSSVRPTLVAWGEQEVEKIMQKMTRFAVVVLAMALSTFALLSCGVATDEPVDQLLSEILVPTYAQQAYVKASNTNASDTFRIVAVSADGNTLAVGAPGEDSNGTPSDNSIGESGAVYVFVRSAGTWSQQAYLKASNREASDNFGISVALSDNGNTLAVGASGEDSNATGINGNQSNNSASGSGAVYVFTRTGSAWSQHSYIKAPNTAASDAFGSRVELSGDGATLAVAAPLEDSGADGVGGDQLDNSASAAGAAYVYAWSGSAWSFQAYIKATNSDANDNFSSALALSTDGNTLAVGASLEDSSATGVNGNQSDNSASAAGAVYVYVRSASTWSSEAYVKASNTEATDVFGAPVDLSGDGNTLVVAATEEDSNALLVNGNSSNNSASSSGAVYVYTRTLGGWGLHSYVKAPNTNASDRFGQAVAISSDGVTLAVGAWYESSAGTGVNGLLNDNSAGAAGAVYSYRLFSGNWTLTNYVKASNTEAVDQFGERVALSSDGSTLVVGAPNEDSADTGINASGTSNAATDAGAVYVFTSTNVPTFEQQAYVKASNTDAGDGIYSVSLSDDGNTLAIGAPSEDSASAGINGAQGDNSAGASGAVYVYTRSGSSWVQQAYVKASNPDMNDHFGLAVALSDDGNTLAVGANWEGSNATGIGGNESDDSLLMAGAVYVFTRSAGVWTQQAYVKASNTGVRDYFGSSVALSGSGDTLAVGAPGEWSNATGINGNQADNSASDSGAVYVFTRSMGTWSQQAYVKASNTESGDNFGSSVSLSESGDTLAVGAPTESSSSTGINGNQVNNAAGASGAVYVFTRNAGSWSQQAYVKSSNTESADFFGTNVTLSASGDTLAIAASGEDSNAMNVNGSSSDNSASGSGAVYVLTRSGSSWMHQAYLKASNTEASDGFGSRSISLSDDGNTLAVPATGEDGGTTGVNGDRSDNSVTDSGAVFTFNRSGSNWSRGDYVKASNTGTGDNFGGCSLSADGTTLAVVALREDSNATGINGSQSNNSATDAGAAYVFIR